MLAIAFVEQRVLITNDRDFGELIVREGKLHAGVLYLRLGNAKLEYLESRLRDVLDRHADRISSFLVVTEQRVRRRV